MQRYRVWEANRKVFLYPENWIQPSHRDDRSPIFLQLEPELLQKDLNNEAVLDAAKNYFKLSEIANLEAIHYQNDPTPKIHVCGRTRHLPYKFYYRCFDVQMKAWQTWQDMQVGILYYEVEKGPRILSTRDPAEGGGETGEVENPPQTARPGGFYIVPGVHPSGHSVLYPCQSCVWTGRSKDPEEREESRADLQFLVKQVGRI
jgi:hypothetical protein